ncbi:hypothetical protein OAR29_03360 [Rhodospirillales bacterium]|nr:hypothetical protein [Rhodospirillales bacterium]
MYNPEIISQFKHLISKSNYSGAKKALYEYLTENPFDHSVRKFYINYISNQNSRLNKNFGIDFEKRFTDLSSIWSKAAIGGWQYTRIIDKEFMTPELEAIFNRLSEKSMGRYRESKITTTKKDVLKNNPILSIKNNCSPLKLWESLDSIVRGFDQQLFSDGFQAITNREMKRKLYLSMRSPGLNFVILGAGSIGLALANCLKSSLGNFVNILVVENRVLSKHFMKPYSRDWLTNIPTNLFTGLYDSRVTNILEKLGRSNYLGGKLNLIETLLFFSCKDLGVKFLFDANYNLDFLDKTKISLFFDATGGRIFNEYEKGVSQSDSIKFYLPRLVGLGKHHENHGIITDDVGDEISGFLIKDNKTYYPTLNDVPIITAMLKITSIPATFYPVIFDHIVSKNDDNIFYVWPGKLNLAFNELLLFINLDSSNLKYFCKIIEKRINIKTLLNTGILGVSNIDPRILGIIDLLGNVLDIGDSVFIEEPFIYKPHVQMLSNSLPRYRGQRLIPVGDSFFTGNPKTGNGLERHLYSVREIHDLILFLSKQ